MYKIAENLYQGAAPDSYLALPPEIKNVVNLMTLEEIKSGYEPLYIDSLLHPKCPYIVFNPIEDRVNPGMEWLKNTVKLCNSLMQNGPLFIHCRAGISRSTFLTAAILMNQNPLMNYDKVLNHIAALNPSCSPAKCFIRLLKELR